MEVKTKSGFKCKINENMLKDWRYVSMSANLAKIAERNDEVSLITGLDEVITFLMGEENKNKLILHLADKDGICQSTVLIEEFKQITNALGEQIKKSASSQA